MLLLRPDEHTGVIDFPEAIETLETAFRAWAREPRLNLPRQIVAQKIRLAVHQASVPFLGGAGLMAHTRHLQSQKGHYPAATLVFSLETGALDAIVLGQVLCGPPISGVTDMRTAATSALATKILARADAQTVGVLGSGRQARSHLVALKAVRPIRSVRVYSRSRENRDLFAREMTQAIGIEVTAVGTAQAAVQGVDIVQVMTNTNEPVLLGKWLAPGQHVTSVLGGDTPRDVKGKPLRKPRRDLDDEVLRRSGVIVINYREQAEQDMQGDIVEPIERGILTWEQTHELKDLVAGLCPGRDSSKQITLYKNNGGQGVADMAITALVARRARQQGLGIEI